MEDYSSLKERAISILKANIKEGYSKGLRKKYFYVSPDRIHYHQWFWDSCFHSIVMANVHPDYAKRELETLLSVQQEDGFIPHIIFWRWRIRDRFQKWWKKEVNEKINRYITTEIQPPVIGLSLLLIYEKTGDLAFIKRNIDRVEKFYNYLAEKRDPDKDHLVSIITPMESGMDLSPQYDLPFENFEHDPELTKKRITEMLKKYKKWGWNLDKIFNASIFDVEDVAYNTIYCLGLYAVSELYSHFDRKKAERIGERATLVNNKIIEKFWDEEEKIYFSISHKDGKEYSMKVKTISSLFPLTLELPPEHLTHLINHLTNEKEFYSPYPVASVAMDEPSFGPLTNTRYIWRGTSWINTNWFLARGLQKHGHDGLYEELSKKTLELVSKFGFSEYYDPLNGKCGMAMRNFGWSTIAIELIDD